jgi:lactoylglutathione lyase
MPGLGSMVALQGDSFGLSSVALLACKWFVAAQCLQYFCMKNKDGSMKEITGINHVGIRVASLEAARAFYEQLGFVFLVGPIGPEPVAIMEHPSGVNINLILNADSGLDTNILMDVAERYPGYTHVALDVSDINAVQIGIEKLGIPITEGPITLPNGGVMFFIRDQDKNVIEFHQNA